MNATAVNFARNRVLFRFPVAGADANRFGFADRTASRVTAIAVARLILRTTNGKAFVAIASLVDRLADGVAAFFVAGLILRTANRVAAIAIARFVNRLTNRVTFVAIAGLVDRTAGFVAAIAIAGLVLRTADRVAFVAIAGVVNRAAAGHGDCFAADVVNCFAAGVRFLLPDDFANRLVASLATSSRLAVISRRRRTRNRNNRITCSSAIARLGSSP